MLGFTVEVNNEESSASSVDEPQAMVVETTDGEASGASVDSSCNAGTSGEYTYYSLPLSTTQ